MALTCLARFPVALSAPCACAADIGYLAPPGVVGKGVSLTRRPIAARTVEAVCLAIGQTLRLFTPDDCTILRKLRIRTNLNSSRFRQNTKSRNLRAFSRFSVNYLKSSDCVAKRWHGMSDRGTGISRRALIGAGIGTLGSWAAWPASYIASTSGPRNSIDVHCHIFNAHDWAIRNGILFIVLEKYSALADFVEPLVTLLAFIMDNNAPTAAQERAVLVSGDLGASPPNRPSFEVGVTRALTRFGSGEDKFDPEGVRTLRGQSLNERKIRFLNQLLAEYGLRYRVRKLAPGSQEPELLTELANRIVAGVTRKNVGPNLRSYQAGFPSFEELSNWVRWAWGYTNWRFQILRNLASLSPQGTDEIRLYTPATIDFANWLDQTDTTPIDQQAEIMSLIAGLPQQGFGARGIIAFDPWRQVQAWKDNTTGPLDWVSSAFAAGGHVGVKIYPARGFRPYFNSRETYFPKKLRELTAPAPPGPELDRALGALYEWCLARDVPIMAHCAFSSFTEPKLGARASPFFGAMLWGNSPN